jgi:Fe-Mn family superoxide dismutase
MLSMSLEDIISSSKWALYNNAAQVWNHTFYWNCLRAVTEDNRPKWEVLSQIESVFWSFESFKWKFSAAALANFWSGWTWLAKNNESGILEIVSTDDAQTLVWGDYTPLLVIDVWEHAYYIDYRNVRLDYIDNFWMLVNWDFVDKNTEVDFD